MSSWKTYRITALTCEENMIHAKVIFNPDHALYDAHFPERPVTPGVCIVGMLRDVLQKALGTPLMMDEARVIKFHHPLVPEREHPVAVEIAFKQEGDEMYAIKGTVMDRQNKYCSLNARYRIEAEVTAGV